MVRLGKAWDLFRSATSRIREILNPPPLHPHPERQHVSSEDLGYLDSALSSARGAYDDVSKATETIEGRARALLSALGVSAGFVFTAGTLIISNASKFPGYLLGVIGLLYVLAVTCLIRSAWLTRRALRPGITSYLNPLTLLRFQSHVRPSVALKQEMLADLLVGYEINIAGNDDKVARVDSGYDWFFAGTLLLLVLALVLGIVVVVSSLSSASPRSRPLTASTAFVRLVALGPRGQTQVRFRQGEDLEAVAVVSLPARNVSSLPRIRWQIYGRRIRVTDRVQRMVTRGASAELVVQSVHQLLPLNLASGPYDIRAIVTFGRYRVVRIYPFWVASQQ